jgi:protein arginine N-methyltransferase 1
MDRLFTGVLSHVYRLWRYANSNPRLRTFLYRVRNNSMFSDISQHERMLADQVRVDAYYSAIRKHVSDKDTVIDLGTGTGVLAFFASQRNPRKIYAIDHSETIELAKHIAENNAIKNVEFCKIHSSQFDNRNKVSVIIHEQIGDFLFNEDMVRNIADLRDRVLLPGGKILPDSFDLFFEPAQLNASRRTPYLWENDLHGIRFDGSREWLEANKHKAEWPSIRLLPGDVASFHCTPESVFSFDLSTTDPRSLPKVLKFHKTVVKAGPMDGFCLYFRIRFDEEIGIDTSPFAQPTHWANQLFRTERVYLDEGDVLAVELHIGDYTDARTWSVKHTLEARKATPILAAE